MVNIMYLLYFLKKLFIITSDYNYLFFKRFYNLLNIELKNLLNYIILKFKTKIMLLTVTSNVLLQNIIINLF